MSSSFINRHITRVLASGFDASTVDATWLDTVDAWLTPDDDLRIWCNAAFGVVKSGSVISKIANLGATRLPFHGDLTTTTANTAYDATGNGSLPAWNNSTTTAQAYFGAARGGTLRYNMIRRLYRTGCTMVAVYKKSGTGQVSHISYGNSAGMALRNTSGSPGNAQFFVGKIGGPNGAWTVNATSASTVANNAVHIIGGTFDGPSLEVKLYVEGVVDGTGAATDYWPLLGGVSNTSDQRHPLVSGSSSSTLNATATSPDDPAITFSNAEALMTLSDIIMFGTTLSPTRMASLNSLIRARIGP
jgi:hypothetical protein